MDNRMDNSTNKANKPLSPGTVVRLKKGEGRFLKAGGAWIYDNEIATIKGTFKNGGLVSVEDFDGYPMGWGYINQNSKIRIRMLSRNPKDQIDEAFFKKRVESAWEYRKQVMKNRDDLNCCRLIFGEADFLPGLTVDKYSDVLVMECLALGMENFKSIIMEALLEILSKDGFTINMVYERSDNRERAKEGLSRFKGILYATDEALSSRIGINDFGKEQESPIPNVEITENGIKYQIDVVNGQKTGFFLDQKYNRLAMHTLCKHICEDRDEVRVLDCFTHMGTFALNCGKAGAVVTGLDISEYAVQQAAQNALANNLSHNVTFRTADVLDELPRLASNGELYDVVILDPPAFTKSKDAVKNAIKGYRDINIKGLRLVKNGGYLATCSCSHFMTRELFEKTIKEAAKSAHKVLRQVEFRTQSPDHPILWTSFGEATESYYLKFLIFQVLDSRH